MGDRAMQALREAGFGFVRLATDPALVDIPAVRDALVDVVRRLNRAGLAVVVSIHPHDWHLESSASDRERLRVVWTRLSAALRPLNADAVFPEILNEPVFPGDPAAWHRLQRLLLGTVRAGLPASTVILTGHDWGSIAGLEALTPEPDPNVVYSFHLYDPAELTSLAAYRPSLDRAALARLPFPVRDVAACEAVAASALDPGTRDLMRYYCSLHWDEARVTARIRIAAEWGRRHDAVVLAGEFGASSALNPAARLAWLRVVREACAADGIGWALWGYDDQMGLGVSRPPGVSPNLPPAVLRALGLRGPEAAQRRIGYQ
jgi:endoglucanase